MENELTKVEKRVLTFWGAVSTMPILTLFGNTWFTWMTLIMCAYYFFKECFFRTMKVKVNFYLVIFAISVFSSLACLISSMPQYWKDVQYKNIIWEILYLIVFFYFVSSKRNESTYYIKGIYYAAIIQVFWGFLQLLFHYVLKTELNDLLFRDLLHMQTRSLTQYKGSSIALSGLCWNAGNLCALICIGYLLTSRRILKFIFIVFSLLCGSRTLLLGIFVCVFGDLITTSFKGRVKIKKFNIIAAIGIAVVILFVFALNKSLFELATNKIDYIFNAFSSDFLNSQASSKVHSRYWKSIFDVTAWSGLFHSLFGWGSLCSGYPFSVIFNQYVGEQWVVECDYINRLWNFGYVGFFAWYGWYLLLMVKSIRLDKKYLVLFGALLVEGITYNVIMEWSFMALLVIFSFIYKDINLFEEFDSLMNKESPLLFFKKIIGKRHS